MTAKEKPGPEIRSYRDLVAWQKAMDLCETIYRQTEDFPRNEAYGLTQQVRRAAVSVPSNIAEGWGRGCLGDYVRFLRTARGSLFELETQVQLARRMGLLPEQQAKMLLRDSDECSRILQGIDCEP